MLSAWMASMARIIPKRRRPRNLTHCLQPATRVIRQGDRTPFEVFELLYGKGTAAKLHIAHVDPNEVVLKPRLVGIEMK